MSKLFIFLKVLFAGIIKLADAFTQYQLKRLGQLEEQVAVYTEIEKRRVKAQDIRAHAADLDNSLLLRPEQRTAVGGLPDLSTDLSEARGVAGSSQAASSAENKSSQRDLGKELP